MLCWYQNIFLSIVVIDESPIDSIKYFKKNNTKTSGIQKYDFHFY